MKSVWLTTIKLTVETSSTVSATFSNEIKNDDDKDTTTGLPLVIGMELDAASG